MLTPFMKFILNWVNSIRGAKQMERNLNEVIEMNEFKWWNAAVATAAGAHTIHSLFPFTSCVAFISFVNGMDGSLAALSQIKLTIHLLRHGLRAVRC